MVVMKKVLTFFVIPPGLFIVILFLVSIWCIYTKTRSIGILISVIGLCAWLFSANVFSDAMLIPLESDFTIPESPRGDVIIVLSRGVYSGAPDLSGRGAPWDNTIARLVTAARLQRKLSIPVVVSREAGDTNKRFLVDLGVPRREVLSEDLGSDTIDNARFAAEICEKYNYRNPILVTAAYHMKRAVIAFEKAGAKVLPYPSSFRTWEGKNYGFYDYLPWSFENAAMAMKEYLGLVLYWLLY
jgi:uncharacterized SAM-binding protein YcdF (DUF218 family)